MEFTEKLQQVLQAIQLKREFVTNPGSTDYYNVDQLFYSPVFKYYLPANYRNNTSLVEMDEVHGFSTGVFLHIPTGIRCQYEIHETHSNGDVYKLSRIFVITSDREYLDVLD